MAEWKTRTKTDIMSGIRHGAEIARSKFLKRNTVEYFTNSGARVIRLHDTDILVYPEWSRDPTWFSLDSGGWTTPVTKERMNDSLPQGYSVYSYNGIWYVSTPEGKHLPFFDGITFRGGVAINSDLDKSAKIAADKNLLLKQIKAYCRKVGKLYDARDTIPVPNPGDCWICQMHSRRVTKSAVVPEIDCLRSHLEENYIHGTLIWTALKWAGYAEHQMPYVYGMKSIAVRAVRRYFKAQLGLEPR